MRIPLSLFAFDTNKVQECGFCEKTNYKVLQIGLQNSPLFTFGLMKLCFKLIKLRELDHN